METKEHKQFSLSAEEVEIVKTAIEICEVLIKGYCGDDCEPEPNEVDKLLTRIKQWQDDVNFGAKND